MPFGARSAGGAIHFRLWAPACKRVGLEIGRDSPRSVPMQGEPGGWHAASVEGLKAGTAYAFRVDDGAPVPDPASRSNPWGVNAPSALVDPGAFDWTDARWRGRPWHEAVVYELHVGTFTPEGTCRAAIAKLDHLADAGITAIELMPLAQFAGRRNWGYDGVLPFAPANAYGTPEDLKSFVDAAHARGLMVLIDCVYNHFGPEGNHLARYAPQFFNAEHRTPWGAAINFDGGDARTVRDFFIHNALYWIEELHFDGVRLDAIHSIADDSPKHIVTEIAAALSRGPGRERHVHLVLENDRNEARLLGAGGAAAQWNDDWHHAAHVLVTGEKDGYYRDYAPRPAWFLARALAEGFAYQGEPSPHRDGEPRGEPCAHLPPQAFVAFLQNHDQVGNRALGERLALLASPEEAIPDPNDAKTFAASKLRWDDLHEPAHAAWLARYRALAALRREFIVPHLEGGKHAARFEAVEAGAVAVDWTLGDASRLHLRANFSTEPAPDIKRAPGALLHTEGDCSAAQGLPAWGGIWTLEMA